MFSDFIGLCFRHMKESLVYLHNFVLIACFLVIILVDRRKHKLLQGAVRSEYLNKSIKNKNSLFLYAMPFTQNGG